jgi:hypothetical protein
MANRRSPENTTQTARDNTLMQAWVLGGNPRGIEAQEARGQQEVANTDTLPKDMGGNEKALKDMGFKIEGPVPGDNLFVYATLPPGWKKKPTDHDLYTDLVDDKGRVRGSIGYKAAFYDRWANLSMKRRIQLSVDYDNKTAGVALVKAGDTLLFKTKEHKSDKKMAYDLREDARAEAVAWLKKYFPDYDSPAAYWDVEDLRTLIKD